MSHGVANLETSYCNSRLYTWDSSSSNVLGRGATAVVYKAYRKDNGEDCAVKVFHDRVSQHHSSVPIRELEIVNRLNHKNVIRIFGMDTEPNSGNLVLGMELCAGGSLYTQLDQPENSYGFREAEFIIVIADISHGMKYLRDNGIIHRDIKPGNIMKFTDEDGGSVYKLTDFGAARQLDEEDNFTSIYGTEEYLDPAMYNQAVLRNRFGQHFSANVDIWSLGVTIYHVATGRLPFQPYGGRSNTQTMYKITSEKVSGVISGIQKYSGGPIEYKKELPKTCLLSPCLKSLVVPVLAGLMESNDTKRWCYDRFFNTVEEIIQMKVLKVFDCCSGTNLKVYINKNDSYAQLQDLIARETEIPLQEQLILYHNRQLCDMIDTAIPVDQYPKRILVDQLYVYSKEQIDKQNLSLPEIPPFPTPPDHNSLDRDSNYLHKMCAISHHILKVIQISIQTQQLLQESEIHLRDYILVITNKIDNCLPLITTHLEENKKRQGTFYDSYQHMLEQTMTAEEILKNGSQLEKLKIRLRQILNDISPKDVLEKAVSRCDEVKLYMSVLVQKIKEQEKEAISNCSSCLEEHKCVQKASHLVDLVSEIYAMFSKHRKQRILTTDEEFIHNARKAKSQEYSAQLLSVLEGHCKMNLKQLYIVIIKQNGVLVKNLQRTKKVNQNIESVMDCRKKLSERIDKMDGECQKIAKELKEMLTWCLKMQVKDSSEGPKAETESYPVESMTRTEPWSSIGLERISLGMRSLMESRTELNNMLESNKHSLEESTEILQSLSQESTVDTEKQHTQDQKYLRIPDGSSIVHHPSESDTPRNSEKSPVLTSSPYYGETHNY